MTIVVGVTPVRFSTSELTGRLDGELVGPAVSLLAGCLASTFRIAASERSFNNELGLPLTLLNAPEAARWVVLEMGVRRVGDIERLAEAELGDQSESEHRRIALVAEELGIEVVGYETALYGEAHVSGVDEAVALLRTMGPGDAALVKGSRVTRLEDVVRAYREADGATSLTSGAVKPCRR